MRYNKLVKKYERWITEPAKLLHMEVAMHKAGRIKQAEKIACTRLAILNSLMDRRCRSAFRKISAV